MTGVSTTGPSTPPTVSTAQRSVLYAVRRRGEATVEQVASSLDMTVSGARQHLVALQDAGLVAAADAPRQPGQRGRSERVFHVTTKASSLFPTAYGELTNQLLGYLDEAAVDAVFDRRRDERIDAARRRLEPLGSFPARVRELASILDEDGYLASFQELDDGTFRVTEHNCAILSVATEHPHACSSEIEFIRASLPEASVERTTHMIRGAHACTYEIRPLD
jgi:DeoR family transcriptional regulator, suf operon transcriptional repressor